MLQHHRPPALMPLREQDAAASALVLHVLEAGDEVGHATETGEHARQRGPEAVRHAQEVTRQRFCSRFFFFFFVFSFYVFVRLHALQIGAVQCFLVWGGCMWGGRELQDGVEKK